MIRVEAGLGVTQVMVAENRGPWECNGAAPAL